MTSDPLSTDPWSLTRDSRSGSGVKSHSSGVNVMGQESVVGSKVKGQESVVKDHDQGSQVRGFWSRVKGHWSNGFQVSRIMGQVSSQGHDHVSLSEVRVTGQRWRVKGYLSEVTGHWFNDFHGSRVNDQGILSEVRVSVRDQGHCQGSRVSGQGSWSGSLVSHWSEVTGQSQGPLVKGQNNFQGSWVKRQWSIVMIRDHCQRSGSPVRG